ncbi:hypothetical protein PROFUN_12356 [Planoprotostelium fungivorum]|uniref:Protein kinase domain-containing protein n=1 Tax=Planoprotostelium fungivorum TaxID=1890364 RepID=A0A2P6N9G8_9EUKA|nr:hypothetical protein PROFUN_12356 [Planoprotostelium fungivorum]
MGSVSTHLVSICLIFAAANSQLSILKQFYDSTGGPLWSNSEGWGSSDFCTYYGVHCVNNQIISIALSNNSLTGTIPPSIANLTTLQSINLSRNQLTGYIPPLNNLVNIISIALSNNSLTGTIAPSIANLTTLQSINLSRNQLTGNIPRLNNLVNVKSIDLSYNTLQSPSLQVFEGCKSLQNLSLQYNRLTVQDISGISWMSTLIRLDLSSNFFYGTLPSFNGTNLQLLNLSNNYIRGDIPLSLFQLSSLTTLDLSMNLLHGDAPSLAQLQNLHYVDLSLNNLTGTNLMSVDLPNLMYFNVSYNQLYGLLSVIPNCPIIDYSHNLLNLGSIPVGASRDKISLLDLSHNQLNSTIPSYLPTLLPNVQRLDLSHNRVISNIPDDIGSIKTLVSLDLSHNSLSGNVPTTLGQLSMLQILDLSYNEFTGGVPTTLIDLQSLNTLILAGNLLNGTLPELGTLNLVELDVSHNDLQGDPQFLWRISSLRYIDVSDNRFTGEISQWSSDPIYIDLSLNSFTGNVNFLSSTLHVQYLNLSRNHFGGNLPSLPKSLRQFDVSHNQIVGQFPSISDFIYLSIINVSHNGFTGRAPYTGTPLDVYDISYNQFTLLSDVSLLPSAICDASNNNFACPLDASVYNACGATCTVSDKSNATITIVLDTDIGTFKVIPFLQELARLINVSTTRFGVLDVKSGSVILDLVVFPPNPSDVNQLSAASIVDRITSLLAPGSTVGGYTVSSTRIGTPESSRGNSGGLSAGAIVGIAVGSFFGVLLILLVLFFVIRLKRRRSDGGLKDEDVIYEAEQLTGLSTESVLTQGSSGRLYRATWNGILVVAKPVRVFNDPAHSLDRDAIHRLIILPEHPNVIRTIGTYKMDEFLYIVYEYASKGSLDHLLHNGRVTVEELILFCFDVCKGIMHVHSNGQVLRADWGLDNILLTEDLRAKISGYEPNTSLFHLNPEGVYAPEWSRATTRQPHPTSNIWNFGIAMLLMFSNGEDVPHRNIREGAPIDRPRKCPEGMFGIILQCIQIDPLKRTTCLDVYHQMLYHYNSLLQSHQEQPGALTRARRRAYGGRERQTTSTLNQSEDFDSKRNLLRGSSKRGMKKDHPHSKSWTALKRVKETALDVFGSPTSSRAADLTDSTLTKSPPMTQSDFAMDEKKGGKGNLMTSSKSVYLPSVSSYEKEGEGVMMNEKKSPKGRSPKMSSPNKRR